MHGQSRGLRLSVVYRLAETFMHSECAKELDDQDVMLARSQLTRCLYMMIYIICIMYI